MSVIIAGGGIAGATLALAVSYLTQGQLPVTLVEASEPSGQDHPGYDARAIALSAGTCQQLENIQLWSALDSCATPITHVHVSDRGHAGLVSLDAADYALPALGHVVELHEVGKRLFRLLKQAPGVSLRCPSRITDVIRTTDKVTVTLDSAECLHADILVAADGSRSGVATSCGIQWQKQPYHQVALIANVSTEIAHRGRAFERFTHSGPLALLPMSDGRLSLVWCHHQTNQAKIADWSDQQFLDELQRTFGWRLGRFVRTGQRTIYPLSLLTATQLTGHRLALVGNAAQTLHPIAGQGFNLGIRDVMSLAETLAEAVEQGGDPGDFIWLNHYRQRRQTDRKMTIQLTDGLVRTFANDFGPLVAGRNLGLIAMDNLTSLRNLLAGRTLGWVKR